MRKTDEHPNRYRLTNPPQALLKAKRDHIAIIPASMLPFKDIIQEHLSQLPRGAVFLGFIKENTRQRKGNRSGYVVKTGIMPQFVTSDHW